MYYASIYIYIFIRSLFGSSAACSKLRIDDRLIAAHPPMARYGLLQISKGVRLTYRLSTHRSSMDLHVRHCAIGLLWIVLGNALDGKCGGLLGARQRGGRKRTMTQH